MGNEVTGTQWAYLAGIVDGEGSISSHATGLNVTLSITNTNAKLVDWIRSNFAGGVSSFTKGKSKECFRLYWHGKKAATLLENMLPYLVAKHDQAEVALAVLKLVGHHSQRSSSNNYATRRTLTDVISYLNKGG